MLKTLFGMAILTAAFAPTSGLNVGEMVTPFHPQHVTGPHKGTDACPPWTYGNLPQIQVWINNDDPSNVEKLVKTLNDLMAENKAKKLKTFMIFVTDKGAGIAPQLTAIADKTKAQDICLAYLSPKNSAVKDYKVNLDPSVKNTVMVYKDRTIVKNFVNLVADEKGIKELNSAIATMVK